MHVIVMGGGVIGVTSAWYLARRGVKVTVIDQHAAPALGTSYANAGQISPGYSTPWPAPGIPLKALKWLFQRHAPLSIRADGTLHQLRWLATMLANCSAERYAINKERMLRLAEYSRDCLRHLREELNIQYEQRSAGTLQLFRTREQFAAARHDIAILEKLGIPYELLEPAQLGRAEPALDRARHNLAGGLRLPNDETGDCHLFTQHLAEAAAKLGVTFMFDRHIEAIETRAGRITGVRTTNDVLTADAYLLACGSYSRELLMPLGLNIPLYPVKGYSLTVPIANHAAAPVSTVLDETYKIAITRFDERIRVGGMADLVGFDLSIAKQRRETLEMITNDLFPGGGVMQQGQYWAGLRPMTPDSTPIVGPSEYRNLFINTGHGTLGWTMACGSGQLVADLMTGYRPAIRTDGLGVSRYRASKRLRPRLIAQGEDAA